MIRDVTPADADTVLDAAAASGLFSEEELGLLRDQLDRALAGATERTQRWIGDFDDHGVAVGAALYAEEPFADRVWNLLFIGVRRDAQRTGTGGALLRFVEGRLRSGDQRMMIIETTVGPEFEAAHGFYRRHGYVHHATVPDFYADGLDKLVFAKRLDMATGE